MNPGPNWDPSIRNKPTSTSRAARTSALEVAIRAQCKRFLAHPVVVQQLEAIWAGSIVFHSAADNLHRPPVKVTPNQNRGYGSQGVVGSALQASPTALQPAKQRDHLQPTTFVVRRSVTLYDPRDASLFKLSRLRVPRYRSMLSTCSLAVLLGLYLAVLVERSLHITPLEIVFWFWSAGYMLDEIVSFNEQGFLLYFNSIWNGLDFGILLLLIIFYSIRLFGIVVSNDHKHALASTAYDVLAADAVFLFPRLFSILDHYRYFSQLLVAFRMMAEDLMAVFILILVSCSGFFVAFTLSFGDPDDYDASGVAYTLFQIFLGYTPAAWDIWDQHNLLGKTILTVFLFICHFLIVTILITVLTNSFMAIVRNANEEHQFIFAVNTISMVKSDALFSYVAPTNILAWLLTPLRYIISFRYFLRINRTVIKATHFPILFLIYAYERVILRRRMFDPSDIVEERGRTHVATSIPGVAPTFRLHSPKQGRLREPSIATFRKDKALEEVFRRPFKDTIRQNTQRSQDRRKTSNVVNGWMRDMGSDGVASPPAEQDHSVIDRLEARRLAHRRSQMTMRRRTTRRRNLTEATMSVASDPEDFGNTSIRPPISLRREESSFPLEDIDEPTEAGEGDDELPTHDEEDGTTSVQTRETRIQSDYFEQTPRPRQILLQPSVPRPKNTDAVTPEIIFQAQTPPVRPGRDHRRNISTSTMVYDPRPQQMPQNIKAHLDRKIASNPPSNSPSAGTKTPRQKPPARARPIMPPRTAFQSTPNLAGMQMLSSQQPRPNPLAMDIGSDIGDNNAIGGGFVGGYPASFSTHMAFAPRGMKARRAAEASNDDQQRMSKLMLARMNALEEGFREVIKEVKDWKREKGDDEDEEQKSIEGDGGLIEMKIGRKRSKNIPRKQSKSKAKGNAPVGGQEDAWRDVDESQGTRDKGSSV